MPMTDLHVLDAVVEQAMRIDALLAVEVEVGAVAREMQVLSELAGHVSAARSLEDSTRQFALRSIGEMVEVLSDVRDRLIK